MRFLVELLPSSATQDSTSPRMAWGKLLRISPLDRIRYMRIRNMCSLRDEWKGSKMCKREVVCMKSHYVQKRTYLHFARTLPEDYELPLDTFPENINEILKSDKKSHDFIQSYWYWKIRSESNLLNYQKLVNKSYKQLAVDLGMQVREE
ncbi:cytochrome c oxidase subunit 5B, putative (COX5B) [Plasmodium ovale wallikeri]|uniref:Cytochrome c oxidase subunit 5B, putative (COX5B) n=1 Tax=Plasmodium ovale wallikeri TaxID=864142 RepID=A0A1A8YQC7_PLAOA|nr:cytochrome c oxidase subunit 5B, putative (COX5B) [Plasmodium ovale wallikeri]